MNPKLIKILEILSKSNDFMSKKQIRTQCAELKEGWLFHYLYAKRFVDIKRKNVLLYKISDNGLDILKISKETAQNVNSGLRE